MIEAIAVAMDHPLALTPLLETQRMLCIAIAYVSYFINSSAKLEILRSVKQKII
jgi:hypothetical protein